ncbi:MAG: nicotinamide riboside transporter PnuC [Thalassotalea sp.]
MTEILSYYASLPLVEWLAVISSVLYVILAAHNNRWCWPAALVSTTLYTAIFYEFYLWSDSLLQVYYFGMAIYGWFCWRNNPEKVNNETPLVVNEKAISFHITVVLACAVLSVALGIFMDRVTPTHFPYLDAATTVFALFATYLVTQKVLENWLYWIVIDLVSIYLYVEKDLLPTAFLFGFFTLFAGYGYLKWRKCLSTEQLEPQYQ